MTVYFKKSKLIRVSNVFVISGPSGSGKTSLMKALLERHPKEIQFIPSHTTRSPRREEVPGHDYIFTDKSTFRRLAIQDEFLAYKNVYKEMYGTSNQLVTKALKEGKKVILILDPLGAEDVRNNPSLHPVFIFVNPPSIEVLTERMIRGGRNNIEERLNKANWESSQAKKYDYIVINDILVDTVRELEKIMGLV